MAPAAARALRLKASTRIVHREGHALAGGSLDLQKNIAKTKLRVIDDITNFSHCARREGSQQQAINRMIYKRKG